MRNTIEKVYLPITNGNLFGLWIEDDDGDSEPLVYFGQQDGYQEKSLYLSSQMMKDLAAQLVVSANKLDAGILFVDKVKEPAQEITLDGVVYVRKEKAVS